MLVLGSGTSWPLGTALGWAVGGTLIATLVEAVSRRGWDNLFVPLALILVWVSLGEGILTAGQLSGAFVVGAAFGGLTFWTSALDERGAVVGGLFAASLVGLGGVPWIVPGLVFFALSSALTYVYRDRHNAVAGGSPRRSQAQVLANGGVAWTALIMVTVVPSGSPSLEAGGYAVFLGALAAAAADTWATELGRLSPSAPWSLRSGRRVPTGTSGAVSVVGTAAASLGAASVVGAALLVNGPLTGVLWGDFGMLVGAGLLGMSADSLVGAFVQTRYRTDSGEWRETPPSQGTSPARGWARVGNNAVNFVGTTVGGGIALVGYILLA